MKIAIIAFPGNNCEVESIRAVKRAGMEPVFFRWNDSTEKLHDVSGYFLPGGFSYEDRGRSGMVAGRDKILEFIAEESAKGKPVIGNCNGAQVLVESGLIPMGDTLAMSLAPNIVEGRATGFINEWIYITPSCAKSRCATSNWNGVMHIPLAHGEGRFTTSDKDLYITLKKQDQIAFCYCDANGIVSSDPDVTPNGSEYSIAGICNPEGNVVALMPHPERSPLGDIYFLSLKQWIEKHPVHEAPIYKKENSNPTVDVDVHESPTCEIFIATKIVNNEERTVEQAVKRVIPSFILKQYRYIGVHQEHPEELLTSITHFNPNKEQAYIRIGNNWFTWDADKKVLVKGESIFQEGTVLLRRDMPDTKASTIGKGSQTGICYHCLKAPSKDILKQSVTEIFANPHASSLELLAS